jgi:nitrogen fixation NifU-like protein
MHDYSDIVRDHSANPRNAGVLPEPDGLGTAGTPGNGPFVEMAVRVRSGIIAEIAFRTYGCGAAIASCSVLTEMVKGMSAAQAKGVTSENVLQSLGGLPLGKRHCPGLAVSALQAAIAAAVGAPDKSALPGVQ